MVFTLELRPALELTDQQLENFARNNPDTKFERKAKGAESGWHLDRLSLME